MTEARVSRIGEKFAELRAAGKKALVIFVTGGDPDVETTEKLVPELFRAGADIVEIGVPFSDPLADGPVIQQSYTRALRGGASLKGLLAATKRIRRVAEGPLVLMSAYNLAFHHGLEKFAVDAADAGVDGVIFPDLIPDEAGEGLAALDKAGVDHIFLVAPTSGPVRTRMITKNCRGFVYYVSVTGITGKQKPLAEEVKSQVAMIRKTTSLPVAAGFGISTPEQAAAIGRHADGVIVGSAVVALMEAAPEGERVSKAAEFVRSLRAALDGLK
jgi:tryptophan synthase alpha chain